MAVGPQRYDPMQFVDQHGQPKDNAEGSNGANQPVYEDVLEVLPKIFLLEIISSSEDHRRKQPVEEDLLVEVYLSDAATKVQDASE